MVENFEKYLWRCSLFGKVLDYGSVSSMKMIFSTGTFSTFTITSVEQLLLRTAVSKRPFFRMPLGGSFIVVVAHINWIAETWLKILGTIHLWRSLRNGLGEVLKFVACLKILLFWNIDLLFIFADGRGGERHQKSNHFLCTP